MNKIKKSQLAYTLIELLVVISIIQLIGSVILASTQKARLRGQYAKAIIELSNIRKAIELLQIDTNKNPFGCPIDTIADRELTLSLAESGLYTRPVAQTLYDKYLYDFALHSTPPPPGYSPNEYAQIGGACEWTSAEVANWNGPYIKSDGLFDPWKWPYVFDRDYVDPATGQIYVAIMSWGPQGIGTSNKYVAIPLSSFTVNPIIFP